MKINFDTPITDFAGKSVNGPDGAKLTVKDAVLQALLAPSDRPSAEDSAKKFAIAHKVYDGGELTVEEATEIKTQVGRCFGPLVYGRVSEAIETA